VLIFDMAIKARTFEDRVHQWSITTSQQNSIRSQVNQSTTYNKQWARRCCTLEAHGSTRHSHTRVNHRNRDAETPQQRQQK
jgi:hypothetical protein